jgi:hypothetical protein
VAVVVHKPSLVPGFHLFVARGWNLRLCAQNLSARPAHTGHRTVRTYSTMNVGQRAAAHAPLNQKL